MYLNFVQTNIIVKNFVTQLTLTDISSGDVYGSNIFEKFFLWTHKIGDDKFQLCELVKINK